MPFALAARTIKAGPQASNFRQSSGMADVIPARSTCNTATTGRFVATDLHDPDRDMNFLTDAVRAIPPGLMK
jgi:hypothetical protein